MPILYLVPTPLGDPDDITLRSLRILREVRAIAADDLLAAQSLLDHYEIRTPLIDEAATLEALASGDVALIGATGTPGIGGAAHDIVIDALARGIQVVPLPGASAAITALVLSGLSTDAFVYVGRLPADLSQYAHDDETMIFTTEDVLLALKRLLDAFGNRRICIAARLTQPNEVVYRGTMSEASVDWHEQLMSDPVTLVVEGAAEEIAEVWDETQVQSALRERLEAGDPLKLAAKAVAAAAGWDRRTVYALGVEVKKIL